MIKNGLSVPETILRPIEMINQAGIMVSQNKRVIGIT